MSTLQDSPGLRLIAGPSVVPDEPTVARWILEDAEAEVIDAAFAFQRWADETGDLSALPSEALRLLERVESLSRLYDPYA